jgi:hypothetical protein
LSMGYVFGEGYECLLGMDSERGRVASPQNVDLVHLVVHPMTALLAELRHVV